MTVSSNLIIMWNPALYCSSMNFKFMFGINDYNVMPPPFKIKYIPDESCHSSILNVEPLIGYRNNIFLKRPNPPTIIKLHPKKARCLMSMTRYNNQYIRIFKEKKKYAVGMLIFFNGKPCGRLHVRKLPCRTWKLFNAIISSVILLAYY